MFRVLFEGTDAAGKSSLVSKVDSFLAERYPYLKVGVTCEPGSHHSRLCQDMRKILFDKSLVESAEIMLFLADRLQHQHVIEGKDYDIVLLDRGCLSTYIYQVLAKVDKKWRSVNKKILKLFLSELAGSPADLGIMADCSVEELKKRRAAQTDRYVISPRMKMVDMEYRRFADFIRSGSNNFDNYGLSYSGFSVLTHSALKWYSPILNKPEDSDIQTEFICKLIVSGVKQHETLYGF